MQVIFVKRPNDPYDERIEELYKIRPYRLITKDTIEEKILRLQDKKRSLSDDIIEENDTFIDTTEYINEPD